MRKIFTLALAVAGTVVVSCNNNNTTADIAKPTEVPVVTLATTPLELDRLYVADIQAVRNVEIRSKISGFLEGRYVDEGQGMQPLFPETRYRQPMPTA